MFGMPGTERPWLRELIGPEIAADFLGRSQDELFPLQLVVLVLIIQAQPPHRFTPGVIPIPHGYLQLPVGVGRYYDLNCREPRSQIRRQTTSTIREDLRRFHAQQSCGSLLGAPGNIGTRE